MLKLTLLSIAGWFFAVSCFAADFSIQRGTVSMTAGENSATIFAGTDYTAPASATSAFIRVVSNNYLGDGQHHNFGGAHSRNQVWVSDPGNITTSITFARYDPGQPFDLQYEIIEYTGAASGDYEFIVRRHDNLLFGSTDGTVDTTPISGILDDNDVVVFITGQRQNRSSEVDGQCGLATTEWVSASDVARVTRGAICYTVDYSISVVEFTGSSWSVQRVTHSYSTAQTDEDEAFSIPLGAVSQAFIHPQIRIQGTGTVPEHYGHQVWIASTTQLRHWIYAIRTSADAVTWVVEDTAGNMVVEQISGNRAWNAGDTPDSWTETINTVNLSEASIMGESATAAGGDRTHYYQMGFKLTSATTATLSRGTNQGPRDYRFQVVQWPEAAIGVPVPPVLLHMEGRI